METNQPDPLDEASRLHDLSVEQRGAHQFVEAERLAHEALAIFERESGPDHPDVANVLNNLAAIRQERGDTADAERLYRRSMQILSQDFGEWIEAVERLRVQTHDGLGTLYRIAGRYTEAEPLLRKGLEIAEAAFPPEDSEIGTILNNLAVLYKYTGRYDEAERLYHRSLAIVQNAFGPEAVAAATLYHNLGGLEHERGRPERGEPFARKSVEIREKALGPDHPDVAADLAALAALIDAQERYDEAIPMYHRALAIFEKLHGPEHYEIAVNHNNLAAIHQAQGRFDEAERLYRNALAIKEKVLGPDHPDVAMTLNNLGVLLQSLQRYAEAESVYRRGLGLFQAAFGAEHPRTSACRENLEDLLAHRPRTGALRLGTRGSELALYQTRRVADWLEKRLGRMTELVILKTQGDREPDKPLDQLGTVGVFTKELERALLADEIDLAVHSLKDLPTLLPEGLALGAVPERVDPADVLLVRPDVAREAEATGEAAIDGLPLPRNARVGTSSRRRRVQLLALRPDLRIHEIRGNVPTRVQKLRQGDYDAIVLALAGVERLQLELSDLTTVRLPLPVMLPAPGQAALGIEIRASDTALLEDLRKALHDPEVMEQVQAERRLLRLIEGGCSVPLGAYARRNSSGELVLTAVLGSSGPNPGRLRRALVRASTPEAAADLAFRILRPAAEAAPGTSVSDVVDEAGALPSGQPVSGPTTAMADASVLQGRSILILREGADELAELLQAAGARVHCEAALELRPLLEPAQLRAEVEALPAQSAFLLFSSPGAVRLFARLIREAGIDPTELLQQRRTAAIGPGTAEVMAKEGIPVDFLASQSNGGGFARDFLAAGFSNELVLMLPTARDGRPELRNALGAAGYDVRPLALYETRPVPVLAAAQTWDAIVLASPSGVATLPVSATFSKLIAIGETTASALQAVGLTPAATAGQPTPQGLFQALVQAFS